MQISKELSSFVWNLILQNQVLEKNSNLITLYTFTTNPKMLNTEIGLFGHRFWKILAFLLMLYISYKVRYCPFKVSIQYFFTFLKVINRNLSSDRVVYVYFWLNKNFPKFVYLDALSFLRVGDHVNWKLYIFIKFCFNQITIF